MPALRSCITFLVWLCLIGGWAYWVWPWENRNSKKSLLQRLHKNLISEKEKNTKIFLYTRILISKSTASAPENYSLEKISKEAVKAY